VSRQPPDIKEYGVADDWTVTVNWQLDPILLADAPDSIEVFVDGSRFGPPLSPSSTEVTINSGTAHALPGPVLAIRIDFVWSDTFESPQSSAVRLPWPPLASAGQTLTRGPSIPTVSVLGLTPKTLRTENAIAIEWASYSFNDGQISWGPVGDGAAHTHSIKPREVPKDYSGSFTTDQPLSGGRRYQFTVAVKNSLTTNVWVSKTLIVRSADNYRSLAAFLDASGADPSAGVRAAAGGGVLSLADLLEA
jgi:hypothetical protein